MTRHEELQSIYWDMYKEAYGFRPRGVVTDGWTEAQFNEHFEILSQEIDRQYAIRKEDEAQAEFDFEMRVQSLLTMGAKDRAMALRWIHEAEGSNGDGDFLCYLVGLPYGYFRKAA